MKPAILPFNTLYDFPNIKVVNSFDELLHTKLKNGVNALCWRRSLEGDFDEIVSKQKAYKEITPVTEESLKTLTLSPTGKIARSILIEDKRLLKEAGLNPSLDCIPAYPRDHDAELFPTDVYSYHADSANTEADTYLCSYTVAPSEGLRNNETIRRADIPETRAKLVELHKDSPELNFDEFLKENYFDLHYISTPEAQPFSFGLGNLWRISTQYPNSPVAPCIHRAPTTHPSDPPRLLLIS